MSMAVNPAAGAKQRIMRANQYSPSDCEAARRVTRTVSKSGATETFKMKGDLVIDSQGRAYEVTHHGY